MGCLTHANIFGWLGIFIKKRVNVKDSKIKCLPFSGRWCHLWLWEQSVCSQGNITKLQEVGLPCQVSELQDKEIPSWMYCVYAGGEGVKYKITLVMWDVEMIVMPWGLLWWDLDGFRTVVGGAVYLNKMGKMQVKKKGNIFFGGGGWFQPSQESQKKFKS